jgi:hypothetical protein
MTRLALTFTAPRITRSAVRDKYDLLLGVEATLGLKVHDRLLYTEPLFPIVELRMALAAWLPPGVADFEFISMESDEPGLVWFRRQSSGNWRAGSIHQDDISFDELSGADVLEACKEFVTAVDVWVLRHLGLDVDDVLAR